LSEEADDVVDVEGGSTVAPAAGAARQSSSWMFVNFGKEIRKRLHAVFSLKIGKETGAR